MWVSEEEFFSLESTQGTSLGSHEERTLSHFPRKTQRQSGFLQSMTWAIQTLKGLIILI